MRVNYDKINNHIILTGKNDWTWVIVKRILFVGICFLIGYLLFKTGQDGSIYRLLAALLTVMPVTLFFISLFYLKPFNLQKTKIVFTPNNLIYNHTNNESNKKIIHEREIKDFTIYYKSDFHTNIKFWLNNSSKPIFEFNIDEIKEEERLFKLFGTIAENWSLPSYNIYPSREMMGKIEFLRTGVNQINLKQPYEELKKSALDSQLKLEQNKLKIGSYILEKQGENIFIDLVKSGNEWSFTVALFIFGSAFASFFFYLYLSGAIEYVSGAITFLVPAGLLFVWGFSEIYVEYYLQYLIDKKNKKLKIRNYLLKWKEIDFKNIAQVNFKGIITKAKYNTGYSGIIEISIDPDDSYHLMKINPSYKGLDPELIKDSIYTDGIQLTRLLADNLGTKYEWLEFSEDN